MMLAALVPTILMTGIGIVLLALHSSTTTLVIGILVLALCTSGITGYILASIYVGKGASLDRLIRLGFRVPPGFCLTIAAFRAQCESLGAGSPGGDPRTKPAGPCRRRAARPS